MNNVIATTIVQQQAQPTPVLLSSARRGLITKFNNTSTNNNTNQFAFNAAVQMQMASLTLCDDTSTPSHQVYRRGRAAALPLLQQHVDALRATHSAMRQDLLQHQDKTNNHNNDQNNQNNQHNIDTNALLQQLQQLKQQNEQLKQNNIATIGSPTATQTTR